MASILLDACSQSDFQGPLRPQLLVLMPQSLNTCLDAHRVYTSLPPLLGLAAVVQGRVVLLRAVAGPHVHSGLGPWDWPLFVPVLLCTASGHSSWLNSCTCSARTTAVYLCLIQYMDALCSADCMYITAGRYQCLLGGRRWRWRGRIGPALQ
jgi:hypothetical protein